MSEMVERIARVMSVNDCEGDDTAWNDDYGPDDAYKEAYRKGARAVLEALREPTAAMVEAGWIDKEDVNPDDIWRAMIDTALRTCEMSE